MPTDKKKAPAAKKKGTGKAKPRGRPFRKGSPGNPHGRGKGTPNKATAEIRAFLGGVIDSEEYRESVKRQMADFTLAPQLHLYFLQLAKGKPKESHEINVQHRPFSLDLDGKDR